MVVKNGHVVRLFLNAQEQTLCPFQVTSTIGNPRRSVRYFGIVLKFLKQRRNELLRLGKVLLCRLVLGVVEGQVIGCC